jgi:hypothetical protein
MARGSTINSPVESSTEPSRKSIAKPQISSRAPALQLIFRLPSSKGSRGRVISLWSGRVDPNEHWAITLMCRFGAEVLGWLGLHGIGVTVQSGVVTLFGEVPHYVDEYAAERRRSACLGYEPSPTTLR